MDNQEIDVLDALENMESNLRIRLDESGFFDKNSFTDNLDFLNEVSIFLTGLINEFKPIGNKCLMVINFDEDFVSVISFEINSFRKEVFKRGDFEGLIKCGDIVVFNGSKFVKSQYVTIELLKICCKY